MDDLGKLLKGISKQEIFELIGDGLSIQTGKFEILYQNTVHKKMFGDHIGQYCYKAYKKENDVCDDCPLSSTFKDGKIHTSERAVIIDDKMRSFETTSSPLKNSKGEILAGIEVTRETTERNRMADEIKKRINELEQFYDMAVGRELKIKKLKDDIVRLEKEHSDCNESNDK